MRYINRYRLTNEEEQTVVLPVSSDVLSVMMDGDYIVLIVASDSNSMIKEARCFRLINTTGQFIGIHGEFEDYERCKYIGTVVRHDNHQIQHIFEKY